MSYSNILSSLSLPHSLTQNSLYKRMHQVYTVLHSHSLFFNRCTARYLLVIEKDAIFQALTQDRLFDELPCVMVTAKGMPDLATRAFCSKLVDACPGLTVKDSTHMLSGICGGALPSLSPTTHSPGSLFALTHPHGRPYCSRSWLPAGARPGRLEPLWLLNPAHVQVRQRAEPGG